MAYPRIIYNTNNIYVDFDRGIRDLRLHPDEKIKTIISGSGIKEFHHYYQMQSIEFLIQNYTTGFEKQLRGWYEYCRFGNSLGLIIDPDILFFIDFENGVYSNDSIQGTYSYDNTGEYYFEDDRGLLIQNIGYPRRPNGKFGKGLSVYNTHDNLQPDFNDLDNWAKTNVTVTEDTTETEDPLGTNVGNKLSPNGGGGNCSIHYDTGISLAIGENITTAIYLKSKVGNIDVEVSIWGYIASWTKYGTDTVTVTPEWQRFHVTYADSEFNLTDIRIKIEWSNDSSNIIYGFYSQLQKLLYPVPVQKLTTGAGSNDICSWDVSNLITQRTTQYSIGLWIKTPYNYNEREYAGYFFVITQSGASGFHSGIILETDGDVRADVGKLDLTVNVATASGSGYIVADTWCYVVVTVDTTIANGIKLYLNATLVATSTNPVFAPCEGGRLYIGSKAAFTDACDGIIDDFIIEAKVLDQTEITRRYNLGRSLGIERNIFDSVFLKNFSFNSTLRNGVPRKTVQLTFEEEIT